MSLDNHGMHTTAQVNDLLQRLREGDPGSVQALLEASMRRLQILAKRISNNIPGVKRWEQTDDLVQNSVIRLWKALETNHPQTPLEYYRLASTIMRRELIDRSRHFFGAEGIGANLARTGNALDSQFVSPVDLKTDQTNEPSKLASWTEFHEYVESLNEEDKALFDLLWYQGLTLTQAAELLGSSERTTRRRWKLARVALHDAILGQELDENESDNHSE
jgi:RNA polymerase sigma factor (sigma-70 family)